jgi:uncharacterized protein (DUF1499 family)
MMNPFAWLVAWVLPACGAFGANGLPTPPPMDVMHIVRPATPNTALAAPPEFVPTPDIFVPPYHVSPRQLFDAIHAVAAAQPRTYLAVDYPERWQTDWVVRSRVFNFPDLITVQVLPVTADTSTLVIYAHSVYGRSDLGVNLARLRTWTSTLDASLIHLPEK